MSRQSTEMFLLQNDGGDFLGVFDEAVEAWEFAELNLVEVGYDPDEVSVNDVYGVYPVRYWL